MDISKGIKRFTLIHYQLANGTPINSMISAPYPGRLDAGGHDRSAQTMETFDKNPAFLDARNLDLDEIKAAQQHTYGRLGSVHPDGQPIGQVV